ncbi:hypothetical protein O181_084717 [Austropuccinia psidii MF-1]|uniref:Uncharacterized protein n=1 Tax=Austropuccinia psidii MF-1 TaxID=1389203 RepID=A0A9Q3FUR8_9BASI|nr:hypothetical protein [Austropuccinia psidii MF-1]
MEKNNMMLLKEEWRQNKPPPPKQVPRTAPVARRSNSNVKKQPQAQNKGKGKEPATKPYIHGYKIPKIQQDAMENVFQMARTMMELQKKRGSQIKLSEMISDILDGIPNLYIAINNMKSHISDKHSSICNNLQTNNLSLSQINETLMCFEKTFKTIKTSNNENSFGNKLNEQLAIIEELTDKYSKFNIYDMIETRIKQSINIF